jgi:hypothetical protein
MPEKSCLAMSSLSSLTILDTLGRLRESPLVVKEGSERELLVWLAGG